MFDYQLLVAKGPTEKKYVHGVIWRNEIEFHAYKHSGFLVIPRKLL
jgi:hypothetical protein